MGLSLRLDYMPDAMNNYLRSASSCFDELTSQTYKEAHWMGWWDYPQKSGFEELERINEWMTKDFHEFFDTVVVCAIGGSIMGTKAVYDALQRTAPDGFNQKTIEFIGHNLSESSYKDLFLRLENKNPILVVVSKSGTTMEPALGFRVMQEYFEKKYGCQKARSRIIAITGDNPTSFLNKYAQTEGYKIFYVPENVGGRYSVLTPVGIVPLALAGFSVKSLLEGAHFVYEGIKSKSEIFHDMLSLASFRAYFHDQGKTLDVLSYDEPKLSTFVEWWKQLHGESEGKDNKGLFPAGMIYSTDLHSLGQFLQEGTPSMIETFLFVEPSLPGSYSYIPVRSMDDHLSVFEGGRISDLSRKAMEAGKNAHKSRGVPVASLHTTCLSEFSLGGLFAFFQTTCAVTASLLEVNPFNQPGVEVYKKELWKSDSQHNV
jgi:glucose-6-phosphate isomerase